MKNLVILLFAVVGICACSNPPATPPPATTTPETAPSTSQPAPAGRYKFGDQLTVLAKAGLVLREQPDAASKKITTIAYGQKVTTLEAPGASFEVEIFKGYSITGNWVKINTSGKVGYVFDGFLSKFEAPTDTPFGELMKTAKSVSKTTTNPPEKDKNDAAVWMKEVETFDNGVIIETQAYEGGSKSIERYPVKLISMAEAYLLVNAIDSKGKWNYDAEIATLWFDSADEMSATIIKQEGQFIVVENQTAD